MTTEPTIPAAIIERAAQASFAAGAANAAKKYGLETPVTWAKHLTDDDRSHERHRARAALSAVYADIQAEALREAAASYQLGGWANSIPRGDTRPALILGMAQQAIDWLRTRADEVDGGKP